MSFMIVFYDRPRSRVDTQQRFAFVMTHLFLLLKYMALCILWSGVLDWSLGVEPWSGVLEWNIGVEYWSGPLEWRNILGKNRKGNAGGKI